MMLTIPNLLGADELRQCRQALERADWTDGRATAGHLALQVKRNRQLAHGDPVCVQIGDRILEALAAHERFISAALPLKVLPPLFNRYGVGQTYGPHIDGAIRSISGTHHRVRTDLSATLFLSAPESYDGGELVIRDTFGERSVKLAAGDLVLYPGTSVHHVTAVTRGERLAAFFWLQSMVRDATHRTLLYELDNAIQGLAKDVPDHPKLVELAGVYHNLLRAWADS